MYYTVDKQECKLTLKNKGKDLTFATQDSVFVETNVDTLNFQIKANDSTNKKRVKPEVGSLSATGQLLQDWSEAPVDMGEEATIDYGVNFERDHNRYPNDVTSFHGRGGRLQENHPASQVGCKL